VKQLSGSICFVILWAANLQAQTKELHFVTWKSEAPAVWQQAIADFERDNPGVRIVQEIGPQSSTQLHDLLAQKLKNRDPGLDVFMMDVVWPAEFASANWALPLDRYFTNAARKEFIEAPILAGQYERQIYAVPLFIDAGLLYFRKDLLQKYSLPAPRTWPELVESAKTIIAGEKDSALTGYSGQFKQYEGLICNMMEFVLSNQGGFWDERRQVSLVDQPAAISAVQFVRDNVISAIANRAVLAYEEPESLALFTQGRAIFHRNWPYAWTVADDVKTSRVAGKVGVSELPSFPGGNAVTTLGGWQLGISRFSRQPDLAWRFVDFMTGEQMQKRIARATGRAPTRRALYEDAQLTAALPQLKFLFRVFKHAVPRPRTPVYLPLSNVMQRYFSSMLALPDTDINGRSRLAARDMNRLLELAREHSTR
jgi:trehalose/maltose transport system substrate-binding protein